MAETTLVIGLDIGGTNIRGGLVRFPGAEIVDRLSLATAPERGGEAVLRDTLDVATELSSRAASRGLRVSAIGAGVAELVDPRGDIASAQTIEWLGVPVRARLSEIAPAVLESDVRAAALGEARFGAGSGMSAFVYVTVGTGISSCFVLEGRPYAGARGNALVLSSAPSTVWCTECGLRTSRVLEEFSSGSAIARRFNERSGQRCRCEDVTLFAASGDAAAIEIVASGAEALGSAVAQVANLLDPQAIIIGGGLGLAGGLYWETLIAAIRAHIWSDQTRGLQIQQAALGKDAGLIGAAACALHGYRTEGEDCGD